MKDRKINICDECNSEYYKNTSEMDSLCLNCVFYLYEYENCKHQFENDRCTKCYWNGKTSEYIEKIIIKMEKLLTKRKSISVGFNAQDLPYIPTPKEPYLTFQTFNKNKTINIIGNKSGLRLMAKALLGMAETERSDGCHIHIDDLYKINEENKEFIINKKQ